MNRAAWLWAKRQLRQRWRSVAVLAMLTAVAGGLAMAAMIGARRSVVVVDEAVRESRQPTVLSLPSAPGFDWSDIVALPYVESYGLFAVGAFCIEEAGGLGPGGLCGAPPVAGGWYESIARPNMVDGGLPTEPDEIAVNRMAQREHGWEIGDRLHVATIGPGNLDRYWMAAPRGPDPWGPVVEVTIAGVFDGGVDDYWRLISGGDGQPGFMFANSFLPAHRGEFDHRVDAVFRLRGGEDDIPRLQADLTRITGDPSIALRNVHDAQRRVERITGVEATALWLFAATLLAAAAVLVGQAVVRMVRAAGGDAPTLHALGMARGPTVAAMAATGLATAAGGAVGAGALAVIMSARFPIGMARTFDRHRGMKVDAPVLLSGTIAVFAIVATGSVVAAGAAVRAHRRNERAAATPASPVLGRLPLPVTAQIGVRMALERRPGGDAIPVRPALLGILIGVASVVAAFTFRTGLVGALHHQERGGRTWDLMLDTPYGDEVITSDADIAGAIEVVRYVVDLGGRSVPAYATRPIGNPIDVVVLDGRYPQDDDEVAIGPATAALLDVAIGDDLRAGPDGERPVRVVGVAFLPEVGGHSAYDEGLWITASGLERLAPTSIPQTVDLIDVGNDADVDAVRARLIAAGGFPRDDVPPAGIGSLRGVRQLPTVIGTLLAVLGVGTVGHALMTAVRRRRRDLAVLRALGLSRGDVTRVIAWQSTTLAVIGLAVGVPLGVLGGRAAWGVVARSMPLVHVAPLNLGAILLIVPATLAVSNLVALWPIRTGARGAPAAALRAE